MRKVALLSAVALLAACGGSSSSSTPTNITGTVGTAPFSSVSDLSIVATGDACTLPALAPGVQLGVSLAVVDVTDMAGTCADMQSCVGNSKNLALVIAKVHVPNQAFPNPTAPPFTTGNYPYFDLANPGTPSIDANGNLSIFTGAVAILGAAPTCTQTGGYFIKAGSTLTITSVVGSTLTGTVNISLIDSSGNPAGTLSGAFSTATNCTPSPAPSACDLLAGIVGPV